MARSCWISSLWYSIAGPYWVVLVSALLFRLNNFLFWCLPSRAVNGGYTYLLLALVLLS